MVIDIAAAVILLVFAVYGAVTGAVAQMVGIVFMVIGYFAATLLGPLVGAELAAGMGWGQRASELFAMGSIFVVVTVVGRTLAKSTLTAIVEASGLLTAGNTIMGLGIGAAKGIVIVAVCVFVLLRYAPGLQKSAPGLVADLNASHTAWLARKVDLVGLTEPRVLEGLAALKKLAADNMGSSPEAAVEGGEDTTAKTGTLREGIAAGAGSPGTSTGTPHAVGGGATSPTPPPPRVSNPPQPGTAPSAKDKASNTLANDPAAQKLARRLREDPKLREALANGDVFTLLADPEVRAFIADDKRLNLLEALTK